MKKPHPDSEDALELRTIQLFEEIGWKDTANCYDEKVGEKRRIKKYFWILLRLVN